MVDDVPAPVARFAAVSLDCVDPAGLADFYRALLGGVVLWQSADGAGRRCRPATQGPPALRVFAANPH
jgi:hypothetical protein